MNVEQRAEARDRDRELTEPYAINRDDQPLSPAQALSGLILLETSEIAARSPTSRAVPTFLESMAALACMTFNGTIFVACGETLRPLVVAVAISAVPGIGVGLWFGVLRPVQRVIFGQFPISTLGFGTLFHIYSSKFLKADLWAILIALFGLAFALSEFPAYLEAKVSHCASSRG